MLVFIRKTCENVLPLLTFWISRLSVLWRQPWRSSVPSWHQKADPSWRRSAKQDQETGSQSDLGLFMRPAVANGWM